MKFIKHRVADRRIPEGRKAPATPINAPPEDSVSELDDEGLIVLGPDLSSLIRLAVTAFVSAIRAGRPRTSS